MGRKSTPEPIDLSALMQMLCIASFGALGLFELPSGILSSHALLAWLTLIALPAGICASARMVRFWPNALLVPALWSFLMVFTSLTSARTLPAPMGAMGAVGGLYCLGFALGCLLQRGVLRAASLALFSLLLLVGSAQGGGLGSLESMPARHQPRLARALVELSPLVFSFECGQVDWTHANPRVYAQSGVEWFPRKAYTGRTAGPGALLLGALLAFLADRRRRAKSNSARG